MHSIYADDRSALNDYSWDPQARKLVRTFKASQWLLVAVFLLVVLLAGWWGAGTLAEGGLSITGFAVVLFSVVLMSIGARLGLLRAFRNRVLALSRRTRHDWNLYLYHHSLRNNPNNRGRVLLSLTSIDVQEGQYDLALQALDEVDASGFTGEQLKFFYLLELVVATYGTHQFDDAGAWYERYLGIPVSSAYNSESEKNKSAAGKSADAWLFPSSEAVHSWIARATPEPEIRSAIGHVIPQRPHSALVPLIFCGMFAHCAFFTGVWLGVTRGWHLRIHYLEIAGMLDALFISVLVIWILAYRHQHRRETPRGGRRVAIAILYLAIILAALSISAAIGIGVAFDSDATVRTIATNVADSTTDKSYDYLAVRWNSLHDPDGGTDTYYRARDFILMESWPAAATYDTARSTASSSGATSSGSSENSASSERSNADSDSQGYSAAVQNEMQAVYLYLQGQNALDNMSLSFQADAKGATYAVVSTGTDSRNGVDVPYEYRLYDNGEQVSNIAVQEEIVLEKCYLDDSDDTELAGFYLVDIVDLSVTDEHRTSW